MSLVRANRGIPCTASFPAAETQPWLCCKQRSPQLRGRALPQTTHHASPLWCPRPSGWDVSNPSTVVAKTSKARSAMAEHREEMLNLAYVRCARERYHEKPVAALRPARTAGLRTLRRQAEGMVPRVTARCSVPDHFPDQRSGNVHLAPGAELGGHLPSIAQQLRPSELTWK